MQPIHKRARTDDQKRWRRAQILRAAEQLFEEVGYEAFAMARLGKSAGVVKGPSICISRLEKRYSLPYTIRP